MTSGKILQRHQYTHTNKTRQVVNHWAQSTSSQTNGKQWHRLHSTTAVADGQTDASSTTTATSGALGDSSSFQSSVRRSTRSTQRRHPVRFNDYDVN